MAAAYEYIKEQRYDMARSILTSIQDQPKAQEWLKQIDKIAPPEATVAAQDAAPRRKKRPSPLLKFVLTVSLSLVGIGLWVWTYQHPTLENALGALLISTVALGLQKSVKPRRRSTARKPRRRLRIRKPSLGYIRAEPGEFKDVQFRSQLEIRLAADLEARGMRWEYEKERLGKGRYLVDFYLPDYKCWVEVKGVMDARDNQLLPEVAIWLRDHRRESLYIYMGDKRAYAVRGPKMEPLTHDEFWQRLGAPPAQLAVQ